MKVYNDLFDQIASHENLFLAWQEFRRGKQNKSDVIKFEWRLEENIFALHRQLKGGNYRHGPYYGFYIHDPKQRLIHKASVRDRVLHHAVFYVLNPIFEPTFISNSFSCRVGKGTHKGVKALAKILRQVNRNNTGPCFTLKCDISKFFASVNHARLLNILSKCIKDNQTLRLLAEIIGGFSTTGKPGKGLPIGNLTSQLFANVYMNEFDQFVKHQLRVKHYVRYTDDFVIVSHDSDHLCSLLPKIQQFLDADLSLRLHPTKITIRKYGSGIDFLGYVILPHHIRLRTKTKRRIECKLKERRRQYIAGAISKESFNQAWQSYLGVLSHSNSHKLTQKIKDEILYN